jgi:hypothetical protein
VSRHSLWRGRKRRSPAVRPTNEPLKTTRGEVLLYHALVVRLSPISPTESSLHGWWIPRRLKRREPESGPTNNPRTELIEMRLKDIMTADTVSLNPPSNTVPRGALPPSLPRPVKLTRNRKSGPSPTAHVRVIGGAIGDEDRDYIGRKLGMKLGKFGASIERITVRLSDTNGPKGGRDQKCQIKVVLSGLPSVVVNEMDSTLPRTIDRAVDAASIAVLRRVQRRRLKPLHHRSSHTTA